MNDSHKLNTFTKSFPRRKHKKNTTPTPKKEKSFSSQMYDLQNFVS